ncbi:MAG: mycofactocin precursor [Desulfuromonadales bacterium]|nr:mycofactocin precursor [Desulfuromonadales bacterium]
MDNDGENLLLEEEPAILEEIQIEELAIDGICGVY